MTAPDQIGNAASKNFLQGRGRPHMSRGNYDSALIGALELSSKKWVFAV
jgi:hypothetical protein